MQQAEPNGSGNNTPLLDRIRGLVLSGELAPGTPLSEVYLAQEFDVSRTPVREVLKQLQNEGLVEIRPKVGTFVREPTRREIVELFQLKESLEGLAAGLLAQRGRVAELDVLERNIEESDVVEPAKVSLLVSVGPAITCLFSASLLRAAMAAGTSHPEIPCVRFTSDSATSSRIS